MDSAVQLNLTAAEYAEIKTAGDLEREEAFHNKPFPLKDYVSVTVQAMFGELVLQTLVAAEDIYINIVETVGERVVPYEIPVPQLVAEVE